MSERKMEARNGREPTEAIEKEYESKQSDVLIVDGEAKAGSTRRGMKDKLQSRRRSDWRPGLGGRTS